MLAEVEVREDEDGRLAVFDGLLRLERYDAAGRPPEAARAVLPLRPPRHPVPPLPWTPEGWLKYCPEKSGALYMFIFFSHAEREKT